MSSDDHETSVQGMDGETFAKALLFGIERLERVEGGGTGLPLRMLVDALNYAGTGMVNIPDVRPEQEFIFQMLEVLDPMEDEDEGDDDEEEPEPEPDPVLAGDNT